MRRFSTAVTAFGAGAAFALGGCGESRPIVEPTTGIIVEKYTETETVCHEPVIDPESGLGGCNALYESTRIDYYVDLGVCMMQGNQLVLASQEYLEQAADDPAQYPIISDGHATHQGDMDSGTDYPCLGSVELSSAEYDHVEKAQLYIAK